MKQSILFLTLFVLMIFLSANTILAQIPNIIPYQGTIADTGGKAYDGNYDFGFELKTAGGISLWNSGTLNLNVKKGAYSVVLGDTGQPPIQESIWKNNLDVTLHITFNDGVNGNETLAPAVRILPVPYAKHASFADSSGSDGSGIFDSIVLKNSLMELVIDPSGCAFIDTPATATLDFKFQPKGAKIESKDLTGGKTATLLFQPDSNRIKSNVPVFITGLKIEPTVPQSQTHVIMATHGNLIKGTLNFKMDWGDGDSSGRIQVIDTTSGDVAGIHIFPYSHTIKIDSMIKLVNTIDTSKQVCMDNTGIDLSNSNLGNAKINLKNNGDLVVSNIGSSGYDGVSIEAEDQTTGNKATVKLNGLQKTVTITNSVTTVSDLDSLIKTIIDSSGMKITNSSSGNAKVEMDTGGHLVVSNIGSSGQDGVTMEAEDQGSGNKAIIKLHGLNEEVRINKKIKVNDPGLPLIETELHPMGLRGTVNIAGTDFQVEVKISDFDGSGEIESRNSTTGDSLLMRLNPAVGMTFLGGHIDVQDTIFGNHLQSSGDVNVNNNLNVNNSAFINSLLDVNGNTILNGGVNVSGGNAVISDTLLVDTIVSPSGCLTVNNQQVVNGNLNVTGNLTKGGGAFKIDHPQDPYNKYLFHSFVESPDMMNIYNGNITTDKKGKATVYLPHYFNDLNMEFRYQLTVIGEFAQAIISKKIKDNKFIIKTDKPNIEVSWQVTGIRKDPFAIDNRIVEEVEKEPAMKGKLLYNPKTAKK